MRLPLLLGLLVACGTPRGFLPSTTRAAPPAGLRCDQGSAALDCFVEVPGGTFLMGAQADDPDAPGYDPLARSDEGPPRHVTVPPFWIQRHEATAASLTACLTDNACIPEGVMVLGRLANHGVPERGHHPATGLTHRGAERLCAWLGGRLPTEAEWELAARGVESRRWPWGDAERCPATLEGGRPTTADPTACGGLGTLPVDVLADASPYGLMGAAGNVAEWTADWYDPVGYRDEVVEDPRGAARGTLRAQRGGSWVSPDPADLRGSARLGALPDQKLPDVGVRCAFPPR